MRNNSVLILCAVMALLGVMGCQQDPLRRCLRDACYTVEIMRTDEDRARGLMFRTLLEPGRGMLFVFEDEAPRSFWMKNMTFPIDIVWIDSRQRVVHIGSNIPPCTADPCPVYTPLASAMYVLEIPAGDAIKYGIKVGDQLR